MKEISPDDLKKIQLEILIRIHEFCISNEINYSLSSGSLIGAVRHKGYIPWDDDIDIYMLRPEFERFEKWFSDPHLRLISPDIDSKCIYPYAKVYDSRTLLIENVLKNMDNIGVNIDVFVIDSVPDNNKERKKLFKKNSILETIMIFKNVRFQKEWGIIKNGLLLLGRMLFSCVPLCWVAKKKFNLCVPFDPNAKDICNVVAGGGIKACIPNSFMKSFIDIEFEGRRFKCMSQYDKYLRLNYGDYMQLPPVENRITHHSFKAYWK